MALSRRGSLGGSKTDDFHETDETEEHDESYVTDVTDLTEESDVTVQTDVTDETDETDQTEETDETNERRKAGWVGAVSAERAGSAQTTLPIPATLSAATLRPRSRRAEVLSYGSEKERTVAGKQEQARGDVKGRRSDETDRKRSGAVPGEGAKSRKSTKTDVADETDESHET